jgi:1-deoxy-D-xylulose-5-phosphate reductoisomerase
MTSKKNLAILGSTGSIGKQTLEVVEKFPDRFQVTVLTANCNAALLISQAIKFLPDTVVIASEELYPHVKEALSSYPIKVFAGHKSIEYVVQFDTVDVVLNSLVGISGLIPSIRAIENNKILALANKESLVVAGDFINKLLLEQRAAILPIDSEHSAIFQCLVGEYYKSIEKVILTASGGPFLGKSNDFLKTVTKLDALNHPNWNMGSKITIDSATLMNKGFEVIEAKWLYNLDVNQIEVLIHPQSIIHSLVQFTDGSLKAQLSLPDMRLPIQYALFYPERPVNDFPRLDLADLHKLTFEKPDTGNFPNLQLAYAALKDAGNLACILNAANEVAVDAFLTDRINFFDIYRINEKCMSNIAFIKDPSLDDYLATDTECRLYANSLI